MSKYNDYDEEDDFEPVTPKWNSPEFGPEENDAADLVPDLNLLMDDNDDDDDDEAEEQPVPKSNSTKLVGKHSLGYDSIFKGKKQKADEEEDHNHFDGFRFDPSTVYHQESFESADYYRQKELGEKVYQVITEKTDINIANNRRKPSRTDFNRYFQIVIDELQGEGFSMTELFAELAVYFSENLFNMYKLLDKKYGELILQELKDKRDLSFLDDMDFL